MGTPLQEAIAEMAKHEGSSKKIAEHLGCSRDYVSRVRNKLNLPADLGRPPQWSDSDLETARELILSGASYRDVSDTTGIPRTTLRDKIPGLGFTIEDTARLATTLSKLPERLRWSLIRNRLD